MIGSTTPLPQRPGSARFLPVTPTGRNAGSQPLFPILKRDFGNDRSSQAIVRRSCSCAVASNWLKPGLPIIDVRIKSQSS